MANESGFAWLNTAIAIQKFCEEKKYQFAFIGGVAVQRWGEPRVTEDVDLTLFTGFGNEEQFVEAFLAKFRGRMKDARVVALQQRVLLLESEERIGIDVALGGFPYEKSIVKNATYSEYYQGVQLKTCSAEDLIVLKTFAARPQDWLDIDRIITRQFHTLHWSYIRRQLKPLLSLKGAPELLDELEAHRVRFDRKVIPSIRPARQSPSGHNDRKRRR